MTNLSRNVAAVAFAVAVFACVGAIGALTFDAPVVAVVFGAVGFVAFVVEVVCAAL